MEAEESVASMEGAIATEEGEAEEMTMMVTKITTRILAVTQAIPPISTSPVGTNLRGSGGHFHVRHQRRPCHPRPYVCIGTAIHSQPIDVSNIRCWGSIVCGEDFEQMVPTADTTR